MRNYGLQYTVITLSAPKSCNKKEKNKEVKIIFLFQNIKLNLEAKVKYQIILT